MTFPNIDMLLFIIHLCSTTVTLMNNHNVVLLLTLFAKGIIMTLQYKNIQLSETEPFPLYQFNKPREIESLSLFSLLIGQNNAGSS